MSRRTTNYAKATYTEIIDLQTVNGKSSIIGIHTPTGLGPYMKLRGFFTQFRKYKYLGIKDMVMCPAANLPVDPLGLTGVTGTTDLMDPRDALNPILFHGCHGENMSQVLNALYAKHSANSIVDGLLNPTVGYESQSADMGDYPIDSDLPALNYAESAYYRFLTDPKWRKFGIQSMVHLRKLHPLAWKVASTTPYLPVGSVSVGNVGSSISNAPLSGSNDTTAINNLLSNAFDFPPESGDVPVRRIMSQQFTNGVAPLGWLPTTAMAQSPTTGTTMPNVDIVRLPKLFMGVLVLPPSYNVEQFFRLSIRHEFLFKDFTQSLDPLFNGSIIPDSVGDSETDHKSYFNWIDYVDSGSKTVKMVSEIDNGTTLDVLDGSSAVVSDSAM